MEPSRIEETHATQFEIPTNPVDCSKEVILFGERKWNDISAHKFFKGDSLSAEISKVVAPTMRHVSRTHRVALDWLFDRINLDPQIQIKYIDTKNQLADILTKGNFTRDEWNHLLSLLNISHFSSTDYSEVMSKRTQKDSGEEKSHSKVEADDEFGLAMQRKDS